MRSENTKVGLFIKNCREKRGLTQAEVATKVGVTHSAVSRWESGEVDNIGRSKIVALAEVLRVDPLEILHGHPIGEIVELPKNVIRIPVLGSVPAGVPIEAVQNILCEVEIDAELAKTGRFFGLLIHGDSMAPRIEDGDVIIVRQQESIENGEIGVVYVNGYEATCKKILTTKTGIILQPLNPAYPAQAFEWSEASELPVRILGKVIELRRSL